jgi:hypothetical protein
MLRGLLAVEPRLRGFTPPLCARLSGCSLPARHGRRQAGAGVPWRTLLPPPPAPTIPQRLALPPLRPAQQLQVARLFCAKSTSGGAAGGGADEQRRRQQQQGSERPGAPAAAAAAAEQVEPKQPMQSEDTEEEQKPSLSTRMKSLWKRYGYVAIGTYIGVYWATLAGLFYGYDSQLLVPLEMLNDPAAASDKLATAMGMLRLPDSSIEWVRSEPRAGTFAIAWATAKFTEPVRALVTIWAVPKIARILGLAPALEKGHRKRQLQKAGAFVKSRTGGGAKSKQ